MRRLLTYFIALLFMPSAYAQVSKSIRLNEVLLNNSQSIVDEYGNHGAWLEIANVSHSTYNIRGMYITTDRAVLDKQMSVPERMKRMSMIPNTEKRTQLSGRQHLLLWLNSSPAKGGTHLSVKADGTAPVWIALYDGNAVDLLDSVTVPVLAENTSYACKRDGSFEWVVKAADAVTPGMENYIQVEESQVQRIKRDDPHGFGITVLGVGIVFSCLALLFVFFTIFGAYMRHKQALKDIEPIKSVKAVKDEVSDLTHKTGVILKDGLRTHGIDKEVYIAVISMALKQYQDDVHDVESGIITIHPKHSNWTRV